MNKTDEQLKTEIETELRWDPKINGVRIAVTVEGGAVSLHGAVDTYAEKWAAEDAVMRVHGARTIAQHLTVELPPHHMRSDKELPAAVHNQLKWDVFVPKNVAGTVRDGVVTLTGQVTWNFQRASAERAIQHLAGIVAVIDAIVLKPEVSTGQVKEKIETALRRQATADGKLIVVTAAGSTVTLSGEASSWDAANDARNAAWAVAGVTDVVDHLHVAY